MLVSRSKIVQLNTLSIVMLLVCRYKLLEMRYYSVKELKHYVGRLYNISVLVEYSQHSVESVYSRTELYNT